MRRTSSAVGEGVPEAGCDEGECEQELVPSEHYTKHGSQAREIMVELSGSLTGTKIQKGVQAYPTEAEGTSMKKAGAVSDQYDGPFI